MVGELVVVVVVMDKLILKVAKLHEDDEDDVDRVEDHSDFVENFHVEFLEDDHADHV